MVPVYDWEKPATEVYLVHLPYRLPDRDSRLLNLYWYADNVKLQHCKRDEAIRGIARNSLKSPGSGL